MSKKEEQPDRLKQFISWVDGDREPKDRTLFVMEQRPTGNSARQRRSSSGGKRTGCGSFSTGIPSPRR